MKNLAQEQLDDAIRKAMGRNAVEEMVLEDASHQVYRLSNGMLLDVNKRTAAVIKVQGRVRRSK